MFQLFETIRIKDGEICNIEWHNKRLNLSRKQLFGSNNTIELGNFIQIPNSLETGIYKCKVIYNFDILDIQFEPYTARTINTIKLIEDDIISYEHKFSDRMALYKLLVKRGNHDEIIIVKNGLITDTSYTNILVLIKNRWYTPLKPLLKGTMRAHLLETGLITTKNITAEEVLQGEKIRLINAMLPFECEVDILPANIYK